MTAHEAFPTGGHPGNDYDLPCDGLSKRAQDRLVELELNEHDRLSRLRLSGTQRLFGIRFSHVFHVVWWDPHHEIYPSTKKHT